MSSKVKNKFAVLLPVKIEADLKLTAVQAQYIPRLAASLASNHRCTVYLGIDEDKLKSPAVEAIKSIFPAESLPVDVNPLDKSRKGEVCYYWRTLCKRAYEDNADFFCLLGDDVEMESTGWINDLVEEFKALHLGLHLPDALFGFGCIALTDKQAPGFPTFPVLHRLHMELNGGEIFSESFVNQDADPFLFQLYRRFGATAYSKVKLTNHVGGVQLAEDKSYQEPRYDRKHIDWSSGLLTEAVARIATTLKTHYRYDVDQTIATTTIDVVTPSYRVNRYFIEKILSLRASRPQVSLNFIIVVDNPQADLVWLKELVAKRSDLRVRVNKKNLGASHTRNVGLDESAAEFILFLDDDLIPNADIVDWYVDALRSKEGANCDGFVGYSELPDDACSIFHTAVHFSGVSFFWRAALKMRTMPWGITANLFVRRLACPRFDLGFIKTGGGEDIDFCLKLKRFPLLSVPQARIVHPWWDEGRRCYRHFFNWSFSDGMLCDITYDKHPHLTYRCAPDVVEFSLLSVAGMTAGALLLQDARLLAVAALTPPAVLIADAAMDLLEKWPDPQAEPYSRGVIRVAAILESTLIKTYSCMGRISGHLSRGKLVKNFCVRFDWFCGMDGGVVRGEQHKAAGRFVVFSAAVVGVAAMIWKNV